MCEQQHPKTVLILTGARLPPSLLRRFVGPYDGGVHPAQKQGKTLSAPGGSNISEDRSDG